MNEIEYANSQINSLIRDKNNITPIKETRIDPIPAER